MRATARACGVLLALLLAANPAAVQGAPAPEAADIDQALSAIHGDALVARRARALVARRVEAGDLAGALAVAARAAERIDERRFAVFDPLERALFGALAGDFSFVAGLKSLTLAPFWKDPPRCCAHPADALAAALRRRAADARRAARGAPGLAEEDRELVELLLATADSPADAAGPFPRAPESVGRAEALLRAHPASPYRKLLLSTLVERYRPGRFALAVQLGGLATHFDRRTAGDFSQPIGGAFALEVEYRRVRLGGRLLVGGTEVRRPLDYGGAPWPTGATAQWTAAMVTLGYHVPLEQVGLTFSLGFGGQQFSYFPEDAQGHPVFPTDAEGRRLPRPLAVSSRVGMCALGYDVAVVRWGARGKGQDALTVGAQLAVIKALSATRELAPAAVLAQLNFGFETRSAPRRVEE